MPGDDFFGADRGRRLVMTRAISIRASVDQVWPFVAQVGRGAGWYSFDWLDNGRKASARHPVSWIPAPWPGDATAIGYLREVREGVSLAWWFDGGSFLRSRARSATCLELLEEEGSTRLVSRISADAHGFTAVPALLLFRVIDSIMAVRQLIGLRERSEASADILARSRESETGARDQYQLYEILFAEGGAAGVPGREEAARWRRKAIEAGVLPEGVAPSPP